MANVVYRDKTVTFPDDMSEAEIAEAMPSIADQIDADLLKAPKAESPSIIDNAKGLLAHSFMDVANMPINALKNLAPEQPKMEDYEPSNTPSEAFDLAQQPTENLLATGETNDRLKDEYANTLRAPEQPEANLTNIVKGVASSLPQGAETTRQGIRAQFADAIGSEDMLADAQLKAKRNRLEMESTTPAFETETAQGLYSGATSLIQQIPGMATAIATGNPVPALINAGLMTEAEAYTRYRERGATPEEAITGAMGEGITEVVTELMPMSFLVKKFGKAGAGKVMSGFLAQDVPMEQVATLTQDAIDTAIANPDKTWGEYLQERPSAAYQTLLATVVQGGAIGGANHLANTGNRRAENKAEQAKQSALNAWENFKVNKQAEADAALANITNPDTTVDEAIELAQQAINTPSDADLIAEAQAATEALPASDILEGVDVSDNEQGTTAELDSGASGPTLDNGTGSTGGLSDVPVNPEGQAGDIANSVGESGGSTEPVRIGETSDVGETDLQPALDKKPKAPKKRSGTLLATMRDIGGVALSEKQDVTGEQNKFAPGGYNQIFRKDAKATLKGVIESGSLDQFLPPAMRLGTNSMNDDAFDSTEAYDYLSERIRNGEKVLPYDIEQEAIMSEAYANESLQADIDLIAEFDDDLINAQLREAGYDERESISEAQDFEQGSANISAVSSERSEAGTPTRQTAAQNEITRAPRENESQIRTIVESIVKRRAAANEIGKSKQFDNFLKSAKDFLDGKPVKPLRFSQASKSLARDTVLADLYDQLKELARPSAKTAEAQKQNTIETYKSIIENAKSESELQAIARDIQDEAVLSDAQVQELDDLVMDKIDSLDDSDVRESQTTEPLVNTEGLNLVERRDKVRGIAEDVKNLFEENGLEIRKIEHSGSKFGPSSYINVYDPVTGVAINDIRISNHSKGAYNSQFVWNVGNKEVAQKVVDKLLSERTPENIANKLNRDNETKAKEKRQEDNLYKIRLKSADKKLAKGKSLTKSEQEAVNKRSQNDLVLAKSNTAETNTSSSAPFDADNSASTSSFGTGSQNPSEQGTSVATTKDAKESGSLAINKTPPSSSQNKSISNNPKSTTNNNNAFTNDQQANATDLLGDNTTKEQAVADAQRDKDAKRNTGIDNAEEFTLTGSNSEADVAAASGAQDLFGGANKMVADKQQAIDTIKADDTISRAEKIRLTSELRQGKITPDDVKEVVGEKIQDFGEKIGGARKDTAIFMEKMAEETNFSTEPFAKAWPQPNYQKLIDDGIDSWAVAYVRAAREEVRSKPRGRRIGAWASRVQSLKEDASKVLTDPTYAKVTKKAGENSKFQDDIVRYGKASLYQALGHDTSLKGVRFTRGEYSIYNGVEHKPAKVVWEVANGSNSTQFGRPYQTIVHADTRQEAIDKFKDIVNNLEVKDKPEKKGTKFSVYKSRYDTGGNPYFIGKKVGREVIRVKEGFVSSREAFEYYANNQAELEETFKRKKSVPQMRGGKNKPRVGDDLRDGKDVTPEMFTDAFGFRGVEFGNYVEGSKRQADLNQAFDALVDLAGVAGVPTKALSLNGELGLAFGARGRGGINSAAAHYESGYVVINLTKNSGAGSLAHEWWHALDNYFSAMGNKGSRSGFASESPSAMDLNVRSEMIDAFTNVKKAVKQSGIIDRSKELDKRRSKPYWQTVREVTARSFEAFVIKKLDDKGFENDYLANISSQEYWDASEKAQGNDGESTYPYPTEAEIDAINEQYQNFFDVIKTKETDDGNVALFSRSAAPTFYSQLSRGIDSAKFNTAPAAQWKLWLTSNAAKLGIKKDEIQWSGVTDWLELQTGKVTKADVQDYLEGNGVQVEETVLGVANEIDVSNPETVPDDLQALFDQVEEGEISEYELADKAAEIGYEVDVDLDGSINSVKRLTDDSDPTKYSQYTVEGGENYKELLLTLPEKNTLSSRERAELGELGRRMTSDPVWTDADNRRYRELEDKTAKRIDNNYKSSHFDQPNILAHVRFDERTDADGNKVLFINEIQSDWGQEGKKKGFKGDEVQPNYDSRIRDMTEDDRADTGEQDGVMVRMPNGLWVHEESKETALSLLESEIRPENPIVKAPFVTNTKSWVALATKRMMRYAVDNGFDKVAFINGQQVADLYDVSKQVSEVRVTKISDNKYDVLVTLNTGIDQNLGELSSTELENHLGKELSEKIITDSDKTRSNTYTGVDLKVGGEGMKHFYDQIVPQVVNEVAKKLKGGKVANDGTNNTITITPEMREKIAGGLPLFSQTPSYTGMPVEEVQAIVDELKAKYKAIDNVEVVANTSDLPIRQDIIDEIEAQKREQREAIQSFQENGTIGDYKRMMSVSVNDIEGVYVKGKIYLNASNLPSAERVKDVFAHEAIGHLSVENMLDEVDVKLMPKLIKQVQLLDKAGNKYIRELAKNVDNTQPGLNPNTRAKEIIAQIAELGHHNKEMGSTIRTIWQRIMDGIKAFAKLVFDVNLTDRDVRDVVAMANRYAKGEDVTSMVKSHDTLFSQSPVPYAKQLADFMAGKSKGAIKLGNTPEALVKAGLPDNKMMVTQSVMDKIVYDHLPLDVVKNLPSLLAKPVMVFNSATQEGSFVVVLDAKHNGQPVIAAIKPNGSIERIAPVNVLTSGYNKPIGVIEKWLKDGLLLGADKKKALEFTTTNGVQFPAVVQQINKSLDLSVSEKVEPVKQTETEAFKRWFGDSKVVDENGEPLVVYHGTAESFDAFDDSKTGKNDDGLWGRGHYFSADVRAPNSYAERQGEGANVMPVYVSIKNPLVLKTGKDLVTRLPSGEDVKPLVGYNLDGSKIKDIAQSNNHDGVIQIKSDGSIGDMVAYTSNQIKSAISNNGNFDGNNDNILFSRQGRLTPEWQSLDEESKMDDVIRYLQDKHIDLKRVTQKIKETSGDIADRFDAYLQEELYHGRTAKRTQDFINKDLKPLIEDMRMRGVGMAEFEEYLWMRHAPERNAQIAEINPDMPDGGSGVKTSEAKTYMLKLSKTDRKKYEALAKRIDAINKKSRQVLIDYGLESPDTIAAWESAYEHYVPLMREDMERGFGNGTGTGFKVKGNSTKRALGSNRAVVDIIANIAQQYEKNIVRGEKNRVATALVGLAKLNPKEGFWDVEKPPMIRHVSKATGLVEMRTDPNYKNRDNVVVARVPNKLGKIEEISVTFNEFNERAMKLALSMNNLDVDQVGRITNFMGGITRYFSSINTQYNPVFGVINLTRDTQGAILNLSTTELAGHQKEVVANIMPALRGIYADTRSESGVKNPLQFGAITKKQKAEAQAMRELWEEYQKEGGTTGFRDMYANAEERSKSIEKALDPEWWTKTIAGKVVTANGVLTVPESALKEKAIKPVFDWLSDYNQTLENAVRLAAYKAALDQGINKQRAASLGKNLTVNFNRKGTITRQAGAWFAFFNAAVQGTARIGETLTGPKGKQIIAGGISVGIAQAIILSMAGFDENEPPEFVRANNFIIPMPTSDKGYVTIPMPLGFNILPNIGRISTEWALSGGERTADRVFELFGAVMESFNPLGGNGRIDSIVMPTAFDPFNDLSKNEDWTGRNIAQEDFSGLRPTPGYTRTRDKTWSGYTEIARWINNASGGDDYEQGNLSPTGDQIDYLVGQLSGGVGREISKSFTTAEALTTGEDLPMYKIPLVGRFYGETKGQAPQAAKFYNNLTKINKIDYAVKARYEAGEDYQDYINENPEFALVEFGKRAYSAISKARKYKRQLVEEGADREEVKAIDETITGYMHQFNDEMDKIKEAAKAP